MLKKIIPSLTLIVSFLLATTVNAQYYETPKPPNYQNGLIDYFNQNGLMSTNFEYEWYDNNLSTHKSLAGIKTIEFNEPVNINGYYLSCVGAGTLNFETTDKEGKVKYVFIGKSCILDNITGYKDVPKIENIVKVRIWNSKDISVIREIDFFGSYGIDVSIPEVNNVTNISYTATETTIQLNYDLPDEFDEIEITANNKTHKTTSDNYTITNLQPDQNYNITIKTVLNDRRSDGVTIQAKTDKLPEITVDNVTNVDYTTTNDTIKLTYDLPNDYDYIQVDVNGTIYTTTHDNFTITDLKPDTTYTIKLVTVYQNVRSSGVTLNAKTTVKEPDKPQDVPNVMDLEIEVDSKRVDLTWRNPNYFFGKAIIYRKTLSNNTTFLDLFRAKKVYAVSYEPLFETNGTSFADLTIKAGETYEYKVTNEYKGLESTGVTITTGTIPKPPLIDMDEIEAPFTVVDLVKSGNGLLYLVAPFLLLGLAFLLVPKLKEMIINSFRTSKNSTRKT